MSGYCTRAVSDDMRGTVSNAAGSEGLTQFDKFNEEARRLYGIASNLNENVITSRSGLRETIDPGEAVKNLTKGTDVSGAKLAELAQEPKLQAGLNDVASAHLRMGNEPLRTPGDPDAWFKGLSPEAKTALFGDENTGKLQDVLGRRETANQTFADSKLAAKEQERTAKRQTMRTQIGEQEARGTAGKQLGKEADEAKAAQQEAAANVAAIKAQSGSTFGKAAFPGMGIVGGGLTAAGNLLNAGGEGMTNTALQNLGIPNLEQLGLYSALAAGAGEGARQLWRHPGETSRNMLMGTLPATTSGDPRMGYSVEQK